MRETCLLIVEDDADVRGMLVAFFKREGYRTRKARNGQAALALLRTATILPNLILLDLVMPLLSGQALLDALQGDVKLATIPVIVFSAMPTVYQCLQGYRVAAVLEKPFSLYTLLDIVRPYLEEHT